MRHIRIYESGERNFWPVTGGIEEKLKNYEEISERERAKLLELCGRTGITLNDSDGVSLNQYSWEDAHRFEAGFCPICDGDLYALCPDCDGDTESDCEMCGEVRGEITCPHAKFTVSKCYIFAERNLVLSVDKLVDDYWQVKLRLISYEDYRDPADLSEVLLKCDGLRGLERALMAVVATNAKRLGGANQRWMRDLKVDVQTSG